jgi:hypothetical protein
MCSQSAVGPFRCLPGIRCELRMQRSWPRRFLRDELGTPPVFACLDQRLGIAAEIEGLPTVPPRERNVQHRSLALVAGSAC